MLCHVTVTSPLRGRSTGTSRIVVDTSGWGVNAKHPVEKAITSALGRALGQLGYGCFGTGIASAEEVLDALRSDGSVNERRIIAGLTQNEGETAAATDLPRLPGPGADFPHVLPAPAPTSKAASGEPGEVLMQITEGFSQLFGTDQDRKAAFLAAITASKTTPGIRTLKNASGATLATVRDTLQTISSVGDDLPAWVEELYNKRLHELTHTEIMDLVQRILAGRRTHTPTESSSASPAAAKIDALAAQLNLRPGELDLMRAQSASDEAKLLTTLEERLKDQNAQGKGNTAQAAVSDAPPPTSLPVYGEINVLFEKAKTPAARRVIRMREFRGREPELLATLRSEAQATQAAAGGGAAENEAHADKVPW
jgi:hypothetical protein